MLSKLMVLDIRMYEFIFEMEFNKCTAVAYHTHTIFPLLLLLQKLCYSLQHMQLRQPHERQNANATKLPQPNPPSSAPTIHTQALQSLSNRQHSHPSPALPNFVTRSSPRNAECNARATPANETGRFLAGLFPLK